jgi:hypothetical protein
MKIIYLGLVFLFGGLAANVAMGQGSIKAHPGVEEKAKLLQDNNQETYRALADEIFKTPRVGLAALETAHGIGLNKVPEPVSSVIKDRLVYAEMQYRQGRGKPVTEQQVVDLHNMLVKQLGLPAYTLTDKAQVRYIRMHLLQHNPALMAYGIKDNLKVGESIGEELSPLQAAHLSLEVIGQKLMTPEFQVAPSEWKPPVAPPHTGVKTVKLVLSDTSKFDEVRSTLVHRANNMTPVEAIGLLEKGLDVLGIGR